MDNTMNLNKIVEWAEKYCKAEVQGSSVQSCPCHEILYNFGNGQCEWIDPERWFLTGDNDLRLLEGWIADAPEGLKREVVLTQKDGEHYVDLYEGSATECADTRQQAAYDALEKAHE